MDVGTGSSGTAPISISLPQLVVKIVAAVVTNKSVNTKESVTPWNPSVSEMDNRKQGFDPPFTKIRNLFQDYKFGHHYNYPHEVGLLMLPIVSRFV